MPIDPVTEVRSPQFRVRCDRTILELTLETQGAIARCQNPSQFLQFLGIRLDLGRSRAASFESINRVERAVHIYHKMLLCYEEIIPYSVAAVVFLSRSEA